MIGSETRKLIKSSHVPVLAVKRKDPGVGIKISKIIVPIDLADENDTALGYALDIAGMTGAEVTTVYALRLDMYAQDMPASALDIVITQSAKELRDRTEKSKAKYESSIGKPLQADIKTEVIHGLSPAISIANYASKNSRGPDRNQHAREDGAKEARARERDGEDDTGVPVLRIIVKAVINLTAVTDVRQ